MRLIETEVVIESTVHHNNNRYLRTETISKLERSLTWCYKSAPTKNNTHHWQWCDKEESEKLEELWIKEKLQ